jgi:transposase
MVGRKQATPEIKETIAHAVEGGVSIRDVASQFQVVKSIIARIFERSKEIESVVRLPGSGRPRKSNERQDRALVRLPKADPK